VLAEFAVAIALTSMFLYGIIEFGQALSAYDLVSNAARIGTRYAIVRGSACTAAGCPTDAVGVQSYVRGQSPGLDATQLTVTTTWGPDAGAGCPVTHIGSVATYQQPGCLVTVTVSYPFHLLLSYRITMTSNSQMIISQ
jgi:Flp pilus assembly protein TadG